MGVAWFGGHGSFCEDLFERGEVEWEMRIRGDVESFMCGYGDCLGQDYSHLFLSFFELVVNSWFSALGLLNFSGVRDTS